MNFIYLPSTNNHPIQTKKMKKFYPLKLPVKKIITKYFIFLLPFILNGCTGNLFVSSNPLGAKVYTSSSSRDNEDLGFGYECNTPCKTYAQDVFKVKVKWKNGRYSEIKYLGDNPFWIFNKSVNFINERN